MPLLALAALVPAAAALYLATVAILGARTLMAAAPNWPATEPAEFGLPEGERLSLTTSDGLRLEAVLFARPGAEAVVLLHGHTANRAQSYPVAAALYRAGLTALALDFRGHGASQPSAASLGVKERLDLDAALAALEARGYERLGVWGMSMGGAVALTQAAGDPRILAVATDGTFAKRRLTIAKRLRDRGYPLAGLAAPLIWGVVRLRLALEAPVDPEDAIGEIGPRPVLLLHGEGDETAPLADSARRLFRAGNQPLGLFVVPRAGHTATRAWWPERYDAIVSEFFETTLRTP